MISERPAPGPADGISRAPASRPAASGGAAPPRRGGPARPIGEVLPAAMRAMGLPSRAQAERVRAAWARVADPTWGARAQPLSLQQGTLLVGVTSAPLRDQLARFEADRLLRALKDLLPQDRVVALRFVAAAEETR